jgi:hypothetical protein
LASGVLIRFSQVTSWTLQKLNPYPVTVWCTFGAAGPSLRIPISS